MKHLPWVAPTLAILVVGSGITDRIGLSFFGSEKPVSAAPEAAQEPALAALAAVQAATTVSKPQTAAAEVPQTTADRLALLMTEGGQEPAMAAPTASVETMGEMPEVTRAPALPMTTDGITQDTTAPQAGPVDASFFNAAQANLARANSCTGDLRALAREAKVYFPSGALTGDANGVAQARLIGTIAERCPGVAIHVQGHSDPSGDPAVNQRLSLQRAEAIIARVAAAGIDTSRMVAVGLGDAVPSTATGPEPQAFYDRRVDFKIVEMAQQAALPVSASGGLRVMPVTACVSDLRTAVTEASIAYAPGSVVVSGADFDVALRLARLAESCPEARLRIVGQHASDMGSVEDPGTGRLRAIALISALGGAGLDTDKLIMAAPSDATARPGLGNSRVDFDVLLETY